MAMVSYKRESFEHACLRIINECGNLVRGAELHRLTIERHAKIVEHEPLYTILKLRKLQEEGLVKQIGSDPHCTWWMVTPEGVQTL